MIALRAVAEPIAVVRLDVKPFKQFEAEEVIEAISLLLEQEE